MYIDDMQVGKAGEYLVCADLISKGYVAYLSEQGLPYDVVLDTGEKLIKIQVKATRTHKQTPQRISHINTYSFNIKRCGKGNKKFRDEKSCDIFALVALDEKQIGYMKNQDIKQTMFFRVESMRGSYRDENINTDIRGRYLSDMTIAKVI